MRKTIFYVALTIGIIVGVWQLMPAYNNTEILLNEKIRIEREYSLITEGSDFFKLVRAQSIRKMYVKQIAKIGDVWIGENYTFDEMMRESTAFKNFSLLSEDIATQKKEFDKYAGYFILSNEIEMYALTERALKEKMQLQDIDLQNVDFYMKKQGRKKDLTNFYHNFLDRVYLSTYGHYKAHMNGESAFNTEEIDFKNRVIQKIVLLKYIIVLSLLFNLLLSGYDVLKKRSMKGDDIAAKVKAEIIFKMFFLDYVILILNLLTCPEQKFGVELTFLSHIIWRNILIAFYFTDRKETRIFQKLIVSEVSIYLLTLVSTLVFSIINIKKVEYYELMYVFSLLVFYLCILRNRNRINVFLHTLMFSTGQILYFVFVFWIYV